MATPVEMPKLGNTVEDCLISAWLKHEGDSVAAGDVIAEIETDKTSFEITAPVGGVMLATFFPEGALVPVFTAICAIGQPGESVQGPAGGRPDSASLAGEGLEGPGGDGQPRGTTPELPRLSPLSSTAVDGALQEAPLSPRARRFADHHELSVSGITGSGPGGRVLEPDLQVRLYSAALAPSPPVLGTVPPGASSGAAALGQPPAEPSARPMSTVRQKIAKRLRESLSSTAQYTLHGSADAGGLLAVRRKLKASPGTADVNINDLVVFCTVHALLDAPDLNVQLVEGALYRQVDVNIGFACDTDRGLVVPVVHRAQDLSLLGLSRRLKELAAQAVAGTISVDDLNGGTFTVSNLGSAGVEWFTPVLNPPQVGILGVGAIGLKASRKPDGNIEFIDSIALSLTLDHQAVDGAPGARFLKVVREKIEQAEVLCTT